MGGSSAQEGMREEGGEGGGGEGGWGGDEEVFESLYSAWCYSPIAALALCLFCQVSLASIVGLFCLYSRSLLPIDYC